MHHEDQLEIQPFPWRGVFKCDKHYVNGKEAFSTWLLPSTLMVELSNNFFL